MRIGNVWVFPLATYQKEHSGKKNTVSCVLCFFISLVEFLENLYGNAELHSTLGRLRHVTKRHLRRERGILRLKCLCGRHARVSWQLGLFLVEQKDISDAASALWSSGSYRRLYRYMIWNIFDHTWILGEMNQFVIYFSNGLKPQN